MAVAAKAGSGPAARKKIIDALHTTADVAGKAGVVSLVSGTIYGVAYAANAVKDVVSP